MLALGEEQCTRLFAMMHEDEIKDISSAMSQLGAVRSEVVERLCVDFVDHMGAAGNLIGSYESTERLLQKSLPRDRASQIMEEIRGPAGRTMWDKLGNVHEAVLANYLKNEYPQTVAVVLSKVRADHAARVLTLLPDSFAMEVVMRMLRMESVQKDVLDGVERTLRAEFMSNLARSTRRDAHEMMADIFNNLDRQSETRFVAALEERNRESAERIKALMFTFDDLIRLTPQAVQVLLRAIEKDKLPVALKGASEKLREMFFKNMSDRAGKILKDDMEALGPVRLRDVDEAQASIVGARQGTGGAGRDRDRRKQGRGDGLLDGRIRTSPDGRQAVRRGLRQPGSGARARGDRSRVHRRRIEHGARDGLARWACGGIAGGGRNRCGGDTSGVDGDRRAVRGGTRRGGFTGRTIGRSDRAPADWPAWRRRSRRCARATAMREVRAIVRDRAAGADPGDCDHRARASAHRGRSGAGDRAAGSRSGRRTYRSSIAMRCRQVTCGSHGTTELPRAMPPRCGNRWRRSWCLRDCCGRTRRSGRRSMATDMELAELADGTGANSDSNTPRGVRELEAVYDIPVTVSAVLGKATMQVSQLLKLGRGAVVELDRKLGEAIDIYVNNRLVARGEVVMVDDSRLGVTMTEIVKTDRAG